MLATNDDRLISFSLAQPANMLCMSLTLDVLLPRVMVSSAVQLLNMNCMLSTFVVVRTDRSNELRLVQVLSMLAMLTTFCVSRLARLQLCRLV